MDKLARVARMLQPTLLGLALLLVGLGLYFFHYVPSRQEAQKERLFRHLSEMSAQTTAKFGNLTYSLHNATSYALDPYKGDRREEAAGQAFLTGVDAFVPRLASRILSLSLGNRGSVNASAGISNVVLDLKLKRRGERSTLSGTVFGTNGSSTLNAEVSADLQALIAPIIARHEFQDLLLVSGGGKVLAQPGSIVPSLEQLPRLTPEKRRGSPPPTNLIDLSQVVTSTLGNTEIAGRQYVVFLQPLLLPVQEGTNAPSELSRWYLAGLVEDRELEARSRPLPYFVVFGFVAGVVLLGILLPFLNIVTASKRSPIRSHHLVFLFIATIVASSSLVVVSTHIAQHWHQKSELDGELETLAEQIADSFQKEITGTVDWLGGFTEDALRNSALGRTNRVVNLPTNEFWTTESGQGFPSRPEGLRMVQWILPTGRQVIKWSATTNMTPLISIRDRNYVRGIVTTNTYPIDQTTAEYGCSQRFIIEPIYSRLRSENVLACSIVAPARELAGITNLAVVCAEIQPASLMETILPPGFHFAVVEPDGRVLFHSDGRRNLRENLLVECEQEPRLRSALESRGRDSIVANYYQRRHHLHVSPLPGVPWMLVVLRENRLLESMRASQATMTLTLLLAAGLVLILGPWLAISIRRLIRNRSAGLPRWLWPNQASLRTYWVASTINAAILLLVVGLELSQYSLSRRAGLFFFLWALGPAWVAISCLWMWNITNRRPEGRKTLIDRKEQNWYVSWLATTLVVLVIPSSLAIHRVIAEIEAERFVRWTQSQVASAVQTKLAEQADPARYLEKPRVGNYASVFLNTDVSWHPLPAATERRRDDPDTVLSTVVHAIRKDFKDPENVGVKMHGWGYRTAGDGRWWSYRDNGRLHTQFRYWHPQAGLGVLGVSSGILTFPSFKSSDEWVVVGLAGTLLGLLAAWLAASFIASRVLLLRHVVSDDIPLPSFLVAICETPATLLPADAEKDSGDTRLFVLAEQSQTQCRIDFTGRDESVVPGSVEVWDWRHRREPPDAAIIARWVRSAVDEDNQVVVLVSSKEMAQHLRPHGATVVESWRLPATSHLEDPVLSALAREYERRWKECSPFAQQVLWEVARSGYEDASNPAVAALLRRGLLRLDPKLRIPGASWRRFILAFAPPPPVPTEAEATRSNWPLIRTVLIVSALGVMAFLMLTQPETWQRTTGVVAGLLAGFKLMGDFFGAVRKEAVAPNATKP